MEVSVCMCVYTLDKAIEGVLDSMQMRVREV